MGGGVVRGGVQGGAVLCHLSQQKGSPHESASAVEEPAFCSLSANLQAGDCRKHLCQGQSREDWIPFLGHLPAWEWQELFLARRAEPQGLTT